MHELMWRKGMTLKAMAERLEVDSTGLGKKLKGQRGFAPQEIVDLAAELGVTVAYLFGEVGAPTPAEELDVDVPLSLTGAGWLDVI